MVNHETQNCILFFLNYALILTSDDITLLNISAKAITSLIYFTFMIALSNCILTEVC